MYILAKYFGIGKFRLARLASFLDPWADPTNTGYQVVQGLYAVGSRTDFLGFGLGNSSQKYLYLPEPQNDFIFAVIAEELGFIRLCYNYYSFCYFCLERYCYCYESTRYVWKFGGCSELLL